MFALLLLGSCRPSGNDDPKIPEEKKYESEINFTGWDIAVAGIEDEVLKALLEESCPGYGSIGEGETELFLLGAYSNSYDSQIEAVLNGGGACVLTEDLSAGAISGFLEACGYTSDYANEIDLEDLEMFGLHADGGVFFAYNHIFSGDEAESKITTETIEPETGVAEEEPGEDGEYKEPEESLYATWEYAALYSAYRWYEEILAETKAYEEAHPYQTVEGYLVAARHTDEPIQRNVEDIIKGCPYQVVHSYTYDSITLPDHAARTQVDKIGNSKFSVAAKYNIRQVFVHPSEDAGGNAGDYYVVTADLEWMNSGMYHKVGQIDHGSATNRRYCGFIPSSCTMLTSPVVANGYTISIPAGGYVLPETVNKRTDHTETRSFNLGLTATGGGGREPGPAGKGKFGEGNGSVTAGWGWNHSKSYPKYDWNIVQEGGSPDAGHTIKMDDKGWLPSPTWGDPGFEDLQENYGSTINVHESWIWHIPQTKTDGNEAPLKIKFSVKAEYTWMDHFKTPCTRTTERYKFGSYEGTTPILPTHRYAAGNIRIKNNMEDDNGKQLTISNVTFVDAESPDKQVLFVDNGNIYAYDEEKTYTMMSKYKYHIYFKAGTRASNAKWYKTFDPVSVGLGQTISISNLMYASEEVTE